MNSSPYALPQIQLGKEGPFVSGQGLGCMGMSEFYGVTDEAEARATLARALELGITMFDTADAYGIGANELFLAPFIRANRSRMVIATKFGYARSADNPEDWSIDNRPEFIRKAADRSLLRLGIETIDLYYMHRRNRDVPIEDSVGAMAELVTAGKVRALGLSSVNAEELRAAHAIHPIAALQSEWSVFSREIENEVIPVAAELGVVVVPYSPLGRGLLTGKAFSGELADNDARRHFPRFLPENLETNQRLAMKLDALAIERRATSAQMALAWLYTQAHKLGVTAVPIPGTRKQSRLEENIAAVSISLTESEMNALGSIAAAVQGAAV